MVPISPEIYSGAAVVMDNRSLFDYIQKIEDRRAKRALAEQEAVDKYIDDASKKLTPTGMRAQDVPNFLKMQNDFRQLSNQYKSTKDPYKRLELQKKGDEMFLYIQKSKQAEELAKPARDALKNPENRKKLNTEKMMQDLAIHDLPLDFEGVSVLGIPTRRDINPNASYYKETPFDFVKTFKEAATGPGIKVSELSVSSDGKTKTITEGFGEPAIKSIASNFVKLVDIDEDKKNYYTIRAKDPQIYPAQKLADYDKKVKQYFPDITVDDEDPLSIALAEAILEAEKIKSQKFENIPKASVVNIGISPSTAVNYFGEVKNKLKTNPKEISAAGKPILTGSPVNDLSGIIQERVINIANTVTKGGMSIGATKIPYDQSNLFVQDNPDPNKIDIYEVKKSGNNITGVKRLVSADIKDINIEPQVGVQEKRAIIEQTKKESQIPGPVKPITPKTTNNWDKYKINR